MISALLFDIGNVLVTFDFSRAMDRIAEQSPLTAATIRGRLMPLVEPMECGLLSRADFVAQGTAASEFGGPDEDFVTAYCEIFSENAPMIARIPHLAGKVPLYLLSNTSGLHLDYLEAAFPVFTHFSGGVFSHLAGSSKPAPEIYHRAIADCDLDPATTLYLDDAPANTAAGAALGFRVLTYDFKNDNAFESELARLEVS